MIFRCAGERAVRALISFILFFCCTTLNAENENYGWPLQDNFGISATFGEFRDDHFHAGIDFSTNGEVGLPVLSIADGKIIRLKVQKRAYGKAIYVLHNNGITSVYAHLSAYSSELGVEQIYQAKVRETGTRYPGDIFIDPPIAVHKGDVIAFSGETGAGFPHLHMELRRNDTLSINPLLNGFKDSLDPTSPTFEALYLYPLDPTSAVDGDLETEEIRLQKTESYYTSDHIPVVHGNFMTSVSVYDPAQRPYHRSPYRIALSIDSHAIYTVQFDEMSYSQPSYFGLIYDLGKPGSSFYEYPVLMNRLANVAVPFVPGSVPFSTQNLAPGMHTLQIEASDSNNNTSIAHVDFVVNRPPTILIQNASAIAQDLVVTARVTDANSQGNAPQSLAADVQYSIDEGKTFLPFASASLQSPAQKQNGDFQYRVPLSEIQTSPTGRLILKARAFDGVEYSAYSIVALNTKDLQLAELKAETLVGKLRAITFSNAIKLIFDSSQTLSSPLSLQMGTPAVTIPMQSQDLTSHQAILAAPKASGDLLFTVGTHQLTVPVNYVTMGSSSKVSGENFDLLFDQDTLLWDTFVWTKSIPGYKARYLPPVGSMLQLGPRGVPFKKDATLVFHYPDHLQNPEKLSIYNWSRSKQKWISIPSTVDNAARTVQTHIKVLDMYALIFDNVAPVITPVFPKRRSVTRDLTPKLAAQIEDAGMLVNDERVTFYVDKTAYQADYDPDRNLATIQIQNPLKKGYHKFWVQAFDYAGNETKSPKITFRVR